LSKCRAVFHQFGLFLGRSGGTAEETGDATMIHIMLRRLGQSCPGLFKPEAQAKETVNRSSLALQASMRGVLGKTAITLSDAGGYTCDTTFHE